LLVSALRAGVLRAGLATLCAAVLTTACAAGEQAQTAQEQPTLDGTLGKIHNIRLNGVAFHAPSGGPSYPAGADVPMSVFITNSGTSSDSLTNVTSTAFSGWSIESSSSLATSTSGSSASASQSPEKIAAGTSLSLGLRNLNPDGTGSPQTLVMTGLAKKAAPLWPGGSIKVTFTFAKAGQTTLIVPVELSDVPNQKTVPPIPGADEG
jgi:hypothetical protein